MSIEALKSHSLHEAILELLTDDEVSKVSTAETGTRLEPDEEYVSLDRPEQGVLRSDGAALAMGSLVPRRVVQPETWSNIISLIAGHLPDRVSFESRFHEPGAGAAPHPSHGKQVKAPSLQVAIWIDHREARVFRLREATTDVVTFRAPEEETHRKHQNGQRNAMAHPDDEKRFFRSIADSFSGTESIVVLGPSTAKHEFVSYLQRRAPALEKQVVGSETLARLTYPQTVAYARKYFHQSV